MGRGQVVVIGMVGGRSGQSGASQMRRGGTMGRRSEVTVLRRVGKRAAERLGQPGGIGRIKGKTPEQIAAQVAQSAAANRARGGVPGGAQLAQTGKVIGGNSPRAKARSKALANAARDSFATTERSTRKQRTAGRVAEGKKTRARAKKSARQKERRAEQRQEATPERAAQREQRNAAQRRRREAARQAGAAAAAG